MIHQGCDGDGSDLSLSSCRFCSMPSYSLQYRLTWMLTVLHSDTESMRTDVPAAMQLIVAALRDWLSSGLLVRKKNICACLWSNALYRVSFFATDFHLSITATLWHGLLRPFSAPRNVFFFCFSADSPHRPKRFEVTAFIVSALACGTPPHTASMSATAARQPL